MLLETDDGQVRVANPRLVPYIATLHRLCLGAGLEIYLPIPAIRRGMWRLAYVSKDFVGWVENELPGVRRLDQNDPTPTAQLDAELRQFCDGEVYVYSRDFRCLRPIDEGIWELKTPDLRFTCWFIWKDVAVLHQGGDANWLHEDPTDMSRYTPLIDATTAFRAGRTQLPSYIPGARSENVVSNRIR
jgi:hypothetical protein